MLGGDAAAVAKLDEMFATPPVRPENPTANNDEGGLEGQFGQIGQYWHGNEPSHHIVYLYSVYGAPGKAAGLLSRIWRNCYRAARDGLCGNDDCGQMSAWYLFTAMGLYPLNPCGGEYVLGAPQVEKVKIKLETRVGVREKTDKFHSPTQNSNSYYFSIIAKNLSNENKYVKSVMLNGKPVTDWKIRHADVMRGGELVFEMAGCAASRPRSMKSGSR